MAGRVQYLCNKCKISQIIQFTDQMKEIYVTKDPNGLSLYSHIHLCEDGFVGINNLYIDHNLDVRSYSFVEIPQYKRKVKMMVPGAPKIKKDKELINVTHISFKNDLNLLIQFDISEFVIQIGSYNHSNNVPLQTLVSSSGIVCIHYYESAMKFTSQLEQWLQTLLDSLEVLVPNKLGLIVEILQFIIRDKDKFPSDLDKNIIKTILVSHDIFFEFNQGVDISHLSHAYGEENGVLMEALIEIIETNPLIKLHKLVLKFKKSVITIMFALLILEIHGVIKINRPGIMSDDFDMNALLSM